MLLKYNYKHKVFIFYFTLINKLYIDYITYIIQAFFIESGIIESVAPTHR
jgi:hypothetical protein